MLCEELKKDLNDYIDGDIRPNKKALVEAHLAACDSCRILVSDLQKTRLHLNNLDEVEPPAWLKTKLMAKIREDHSARRHLFLRLFRRFPYGIPITAMATVVVAAISVIVFRTMPPEIKNGSQSAPEHTVAPSSTFVPQKAQDVAELKSLTEIQKDTVPADSSGQKAVLTQKEKTETPSPSLEKAEDIRNDRKLEKPAATPSPPLMSAPLGASRGLQSQVDAETASHGKQTYEAAPSAPAGAVPARESMKYEAKKMEAEGDHAYDRIIEDRYPDGSSKLVVTYRGKGDKRSKVMEERFDDLGRRHGLHFEYYPSGKAKIEVLYDHGVQASIREFNADGSIKKEAATHDLPWLKYDLNK